ncbi:MAG: hypothetical protein M3Q30_24190 [Actinomycetota bacterium]|nr:hypothetical protein [Actinomycetota bacterium]
MGVFVVGMHRSGTSAVAAALEALGLDVGAAERQMAADAANPAGYYELQETSDLNDEILALFGGAWDGLPQLAAGWELEPEMTPYYRRAASIVGKRLTKNRWLIKDPRIAPLLPLWRRAVLDRCAAILIVRDPMEVAWSLALRNGMPILTGLALWSDYNRRALVGLSGLPVHVCSYDELVSAPLASMTSIRASLESWNELSADAQVELAAARIQPELRRNTWPRDNADALEVPSEIERLAKFFADLAGAHGVFEPGHPPPSPWEEALLVERRTGLVRLRAATTEVEVAIRQRDERDEEVKFAIQQRDENALEREALGQQLHARNLEFDALCETARSEKAHVGDEKDRLGRDLEAVRARLAEVEADLAEVQTRRRNAEKALRMTTRRLEARERSFPVRVARAIKRVRGR